VFSLAVNNEKKYVLTCKENQVEFQAKVSIGSHKVLIKPLISDIDIYTDSLRLAEYNENIDTRFIWFKYNKQEIAGHYVIKQGKTLACHFLHFDSKRETEYILIPPNNFIMCAGQPLITDTIRISLK
jgi:hypothetical protein